MQDLEQTIYECQRGNALAWEALIKQYQGRVYGVAWYFFRNAEEAEDVSQEAFVKVYRRLGTFRNEVDSFVPWLLAITRNCCIDRLRKLKTKSRYEDQFEEEIETISAKLETQHDDPESINGEQQRRNLLYQALDEFDATNRDIILLKDIQGMKTEDVAEILSLPIGTVKSKSNRARIKLAKILSSLSDYKIKRSGAV